MGKSAHGAKKLHGLRISRRGFARVVHAPLASGLFGGMSGLTTLFLYFAMKILIRKKPSTAYYLMSEERGIKRGGINQVSFWPSGELMASVQHSYMRYLV